MAGVKRRFVGVDASMGVELTQSLPGCERLRHRSAMHRQYQCRRPCSARDFRGEGEKVPTDGWPYPSVVSPGERGNQARTGSNAFARVRGMTSGSRSARQMIRLFRLGPLRPAPHQVHRPLAHHHLAALVQHLHQMRTSPRSGFERDRSVSTTVTRTRSVSSGRTGRIQRSSSMPGDGSVATLTDSARRTAASPSPRCASRWRSARRTLRAPQTPDRRASPADRSAWRMPRSRPPTPRPRRIHRPCRHDNPRSSVRPEEPSRRLPWQAIRCAVARQLSAMQYAASQ